MADVATHSPERRQTPREEVANSISHAVGLAAVLICAPLLVSHAATVGSGQFVVGVCIFVASAALLYLGSTLYHAIPDGRAKHVFRILEHSAIFVLIAGTYTPFMLGALHGPWGWTLVSLIWAMAIAGVLLKVIGGPGHPRLSLALYIGMGWLVIVAVKPLWLHVPLRGLELILAGGVAYTVGTAFFAADRIRYAHFIWHLFVLAGTTFHFIAIWNYAY